MRNEGERRILPERLAGRLLAAAVVPAVLAGARLRTAGAVVLAYHDIGPDGSDATSYLLPAGMFRRHLHLVRRWGLRLVDLGELTDAFLEGRPLDGMVAVTFDDACRGVQRYALPVLQELGVPATVFAVSGALGARPEWAPPGTHTMTVADLNEVARAGLCIGSHTGSHPDLLTLDEGSLDRELAGSRVELEEIVGQPVEYLAYPFGHHDDRVRAGVHRAGYKAAFTFLDGRIGAGLDRYRLPRITMYGGHHRLRLAYQLARPASSWPDHQVDRAPLASPFLRSWWLEGVAGPRPCYALVCEGDQLLGGVALEEDRPVGIARLRPIGVLLGADQLDLVAAPGREEEVVQALRGWMRGHRAGIVDLPGCYERARLARVLPRPRVEVVDVAPWTSLPASFSDFLASRPGELRSQVDRPRRRLSREGASHRVVEAGDVARALAELRRLHEQVFGPASQFLPVFDRFARAAPAGLARHELVMHEFAVDDRTVAVNVCFEVAGRLSYYQIGRDTDRRWRGSGTALMAHSVEHAIDAGCRELDLMRGREAYKRLWADEARDVVRVQSVRGLRGRLAGLALPVARGVRSGARRIASREPGPFRRPGDQ